MNQALDEAPYEVDDARNRRAWWTVAAAAAIACGVWLWVNVLPPDEPNASAPTESIFPWNRSGKSDAPLPITRQAPSTPTDRSLMVDGTGHLKVTRSVRNLFDSFLASTSKEPQPEVRKRIVEYIDSHLPKLAAADAQTLLDHYLSYEQARNALDQNASDATLNPDERQSRLYVLEDLRTRHFSASERMAFFGDDLAVERFAIARLRVLQDSTLTPLDQANRLHELYAELPAALQTTLAEANQVNDLNVLMDGWRAQKGTPQELRSIREALLGTQAANDLAALEKQRGLRLRKQRDYNVQRQAVMTDASLSDIQRQQALNRLQDQLAQDLAQLDAQQPHPAIKP